LSVTKKQTPHKVPIRPRPSYEDGLNIQYHLKRKKHSFISIGDSLGVSNQIVVNVVFGRRRSLRIEAEIARILGKAGWNEVVLEARSEVQGKPVEAIRLEEEQRLKARDSRQLAGVSQAIAESHRRGA
jgi:urease accessory protein UreE